MMNSAFFKKSVNDDPNDIKFEFETGYSIEIIFISGYGYSVQVYHNSTLVPNYWIYDVISRKGGLTEVEVCKIICTVSQMGR